MDAEFTPAEPEITPAEPAPTGAAAEETPPTPAEPEKPVDEAEPEESTPQPDDRIFGAIAIGLMVLLAVFVVLILIAAGRTPEGL